MGDATLHEFMHNLQEVNSILKIGVGTFLHVYDVVNIL